MAMRILTGIGIGIVLIAGVGCTTDRADSEVVALDPSAEVVVVDKVATPKPVAKVVVVDQVARPSRSTKVTAADNAVEPTRADDTVGVINNKADNSVQNLGDEKPSSLTAQDQSNSESDVALTIKIRRALTQNDDLSVYAHNVKIITNQGDVDLKGPVRTLEEKGLVEKTAIRFAGISNVKSELEVSPK